MMSVSVDLRMLSSEVHTHELRTRSYEESRIAMSYSRGPQPSKRSADSAEPHGEPLEVARKRSVPDLYVLDPSFRVVLSWTSGKTAGDVEVFDAERGLLTPDVDRVVRRLAVDVANGESLALVPPSLIIRMVELNGSAELHYGIFAERYQSRDNMREAAKRYGISRRETEVLNLLVQGAATGEIAAKLHIAETTVQDHIKNIAAKTNARSRTEIVAKVLGPGI